MRSLFISKMLGTGKVNRNKEIEGRKHILDEEDELYFVDYFIGNSLLVLNVF